MNCLSEKIEAATRLFRDVKETGGKVVVLMSGGVDSTLCAMLALRAGCEVIGATMMHFGDDSSVKAASDVCTELGVEGWVFDLRDDFDRLVAEPFKAAYMRGETPNPCAMCNPAIKFGLLWDRIAERFGSENFIVATGHYARTVRTAAGVELCKGFDESKDQSYFLCMVPKARVDRLVLPLGDFTKDDSRQVVRLLAGENALIKKIADKPESMEICFLAEGNYRNFLSGSGTKGPIVDQGGNVLGGHNGIENFTIGQRKGLGVTSKHPLFVARIIPSENTVVVAEREAVMQKNVTAKNMNVLLPDAFADGARLEGKIRSQARATPCKITLHTDGSLAATFDAPQFAPAPGQYLALYDGDKLVAGGEIILE